MKTDPRKLSVGFLFDDTLDSDAGVAQYVKALGAWLSGQGHNVSYLVGETRLTNWAGGRVYSLAKNQTVYFNGNKLSIPLPVRQKTLKPVVKGLNLDILHVMTPYSPLMAQKVINLVGPRTTVVGTFHIFPSGYLSILGSHLLRVWCRRSLKRFDGFMSVSPVAAGFAKRSFGINSTVVPNPVELQRYKTATRTVKEHNEIVFLGRLVKRKGTQQLIDAFAQLVKRLPDTKLVIAGTGPEQRSLQRRVNRLKLTQKVKFLGYIDEKSKPGLLAGSAVACFPSLAGESFGIVLIEAMAAGARTVLAGDNPGYRSVLAGQPKLLIDPSNTRAFAERLEELLTQTTAVQKLARWQRQEVKKYDIKTVGPQVLNYYLRAIARADKLGHN